MSLLTSTDPEMDKSSVSPSASEMRVQCPALFLAAPASGQGKTTFTAALARYVSRQGKCVRIFKTGPDYLDPQILELASGQPVVPLDLWMAGESWCQDQLYQAAQEADLILIEGAMGLFDGEPSSADLAARFGIPIALVMDVKGMAQTAAAIATGLADYRSDIQCLGLIANNCGSARHQELIEQALPTHVPLLCTFPREPEFTLPERHLGLVQASEHTTELERCIDAAADFFETFGDGLLANIPPSTFSAVEEYLGATSTDSEHRPVSSLAADNLLVGHTIAVARDAAFSFIYQQNLDCLQALGAELVFFSPLDEAEPNNWQSADALWLPGGYPELHATALAANSQVIEAVQRFKQENKPILAECGGMLFCLQSLTDLDHECHTMAGLLPGHGVMRGKRGCQGMQTACLPEGDIRGHAHHRSRTEDTPEAISFARRQRHPAPGEAIYRDQNLTATYLHLFFPSNPRAVAKLFKGE